MRLHDAGNAFERGEHNTINIQLNCIIGPLSKISVSHDGGVGSDWHLDYITLQDLNLNETKTFLFQEWIKGGAVYDSYC